MVKYIVAIILFGVIILFHEWGHFLLAKANGIRVNEFCLGLGPTIVGFTKGETKYSLKLFPIGGACIMEGEDEESDDSRSFQKKSVWARISVVAAGPVFNFILAFLFAVIIIACIGVSKPVIGDVVENSPAQEAGIQAGDEIVKINRKQIHFYQEISMYTLFHDGDPVEVTYERDGARYTTELTPAYDEERGGYLYGVLCGSRLYKVRAGGDYCIRCLAGEVLDPVHGAQPGNAGDEPGKLQRFVGAGWGIVKTIGDTYEQSLIDGYFYVFFEYAEPGNPAVGQSGSYEPAANPGAGRRAAGLFGDRGHPRETDQQRERGHGSFYRPDVPVCADGGDHVQ